MYALRKIQWLLIIERDPLRRACRGEALCQIIRTSTWLPWDGCVLKAWVSEERCLRENRKLVTANPEPCLVISSKKPSTCSSKSFQKHCRLALRATEQTGAKPVLVSCQGIPALKVGSIGAECRPYYDHRVMESIIALFQIMSATVSLYRSRGEQFVENSSNDMVMQLFL